MNEPRLMTPVWAYERDEIRALHQPVSPCICYPTCHIARLLADSARAERLTVLLLKSRGELAEGHPREECDDGEPCSAHAMIDRIDAELLSEKRSIE